MVANRDGESLVSQWREANGWPGLTWQSGDRQSEWLAAYRDLAQRIEVMRHNERQAAFREAVAIIVGQPVAHYIYSGAQPMAAETFRDNCVKAIEATAAIEDARHQRTITTLQSLTLEVEEKQ